LKNTSKAKNKNEELGKLVANIYETGYLDTGKSLKMSFVKGFLQGLGGVVGATLGVALLLWLLSFFDELPFIGELINNARNTIDQ
jgi:hypothetical protein